MSPDLKGVSQMMISHRISGRRTAVILASAVAAVAVALPFLPAMAAPSAPNPAISVLSFGGPDDGTYHDI